MVRQQLTWETKANFLAEVSTYTVPNSISISTHCEAEKRITMSNAEREQQGF